KLRLDDPVSKYVPGLTRGNDVTVRMLLSHTSGYQDFWPQDYVMPGMLVATTPQAIADAWAKKPLDFEPGSRWQYSNTNYTLAGMVVEKAAGMPFFQYVRARILLPVGLTSASDFDINPRAATATGYIRYGLGPLRPAPDAGAGWMWAAGELAMTASDLAKWDICLIRHCLLSPQSYRERQPDRADSLHQRRQAGREQDGAGESNLRGIAARDDRSLTLHIERELLLQRSGSQGFSVQPRSARRSDGIRADAHGAARRNDVS